MGNRGNVIFVSGETISPNIYLHWNGGPESVYAWLEELERRKVRADADYEAARFVQIVGEFFSHDGGHELSLGIVSAPLGEISPKSLGTVHTDPSDNGFYIVDRTGPSLVVRRFVEQDYSSGLRELTWDEVLLERARAESSNYRSAFADQYAELEAWRQGMRAES